MLFQPFTISAFSLHHSHPRTSFVFQYHQFPFQHIFLTNPPLAIALISSYVSHCTFLSFLFPPSGPHTFLTHYPPCAGLLFWRTEFPPNACGTINSLAVACALPATLRVPLWSTSLAPTSFILLHRFFLDI